MLNLFKKIKLYFREYKEFLEDVNIFRTREIFIQYMVLTNETTYMFSKLNTYPTV